MDAFERGVKVGREYLCGIDPHKTTIAEAGAMARLCAKQYYKGETKQQEFAKGWQAIIQQYHTIFKDYPTKLSIMGITFRCEHCGMVFEIEYDNPVDLSVVRKVKEEPCPICQDTGKVAR